MVSTHPWVFFLNVHFLLQTRPDPERKLPSEVGRTLTLEQAGISAEGPLISAGGALVTTGTGLEISGRRGFIMFTGSTGGSGISAEGSSGFPGRNGHT